MENCQNLFYLCLVLCGVILTMLTMFFGYSLKLDARTVKLEKKNGHELDRLAKLEARDKQIDELKKAVEELKRGERVNPS